MSASHLPQTVALLSNFPATLNALLRPLPDSLAMANEGDGTWSAYDILGHLIHGEKTDWIPRAKIILQSGERQPFEPFDREAQAKETRRPLIELLDEFARLRAQNLAELQELRLQDTDMAKRGIHPAFGSVTMSQLLATWTSHDLSHLHQLSRLLAHQYREAVGPWTVYLGVLQCAGHSS